MRVASLDIGTNTVLLLIVEVAGSHIRVIRDDHAIARLGEGVDRTQRISDDAYARFETVLRKHAETIGGCHIDQIAAVATSAMRDAENRQDIIRRAKKATGIAIELLSGDDESQWTYRGALVGMSLDSNSTIAVIDIGGGSTELSIGDGRAFHRGSSVDIGAVRITERCFATSPVTREAAEDARKIIREALDTFNTLIATDAENTELVAVAGTPTTLAAMDLELSTFDAKKVHNHILHKARVDQLVDTLLKVDTQTLLSHYPCVNKARADILPAGALILQEVMQRANVDRVRVSTQGLRYGIALREAIRECGERDFTLQEESSVKQQ